MSEDRTTKYWHGVFVDNGHGEKFYQAHMVRDAGGDVYSIISRGWDYKHNCLCASLHPSEDGMPFNVPVTEIA